jgi:endonuclease/exonuclease/phosphatase family metal-dependent hydrolase
MGLVLPGLRPPVRGKTVRVLSYNVDTGNARREELLARVDALRPDIVLFQESWSPALCAGLRSRYTHVECISQFVIASRFAILDRTDPEPVEHFGRRRSARFMRYRLDSSLGELAVYSVHPISPRGAVRLPQWSEVTRRSGGPFWRAESEILNNALLREEQAAAVVALARREQVPVLIAGDTNLPGLSAALHRHFSEYRDGFARASWGFGYTYPARRPFLRLDRMMVGAPLDFADFQVGCPDASDHLCIVGDVFRH